MSSLTFWPKLAHFHHFSICNQNQSISILVIFGQNTKAIALLFGQNWLIFITFQSAIKINQFQFRSCLAKIPRLQPYFLAKIGSFSSLSICNQKSINVNFDHFWPKYQGYSLTFWPKLAHFHHFSICNQTQSISISVIFGQNTKTIELLFGPNLAHCHHCSICNQNQSISILVIFGQNTKAIALLFGQNWLIFITFQSAIKINQFQFRSFLAKIPRLQPYCLAKIGSFSSLFNLQSKSINFNFGHFWPKYQGYSLTFWPKLAHFHHFSICNQNQSISISVMFGQNTKTIELLFGQNWLIVITFQSAIKINQFQFRSFLAKIPRLQPYFLAKLGSFSSLFNLQSKSINFNFGHLWPKYQGYSLTFWPKLAHFHHFSICNQTQSISISVNFWPKYQGYSLTFWPKLAHFHHFSICNQNHQFQFWSFVAKYQGYSLTFWPKLAHFHHFSICNQNQSISISVIFGQNTKAIALLFGQNWLIFITFQSAIKVNQCQFRSFLAKIPRLQPYCLAKIGSFSSLFNLQSKSINSNFGHFWPKYQGYRNTFWPKVAHFHHFSICNQNQSISISVIQAKIPRLQPYFLAKIGSFSSLFNLQSNSINFNFGHFWPKYQGYSLTFWPKLAHFHHFSICNQNQSIQFRSFFAKIPRLQNYFLAKIGSFSSLFNLQSKSINFNFGHVWPKYQGYSLTFWPKLAHFHHFSICNQNQSIPILVIFGQNTKAIALLFGQNWLIFITFQSAIKLNQFQCRLMFGQNTKAIALLLAKIGSFSSLFNLQSKSINFNFGHFWPKYQGYSLTFWPKLAHFHHFSICNQNQSISISVMFGQTTKAIALPFGQNWLSFITCQSAIKLNQFQFRSFLAKIPRLQNYFLAKIGSFSSLVNLQSKSINFNFGHFWPKYQGYSLTVWPKLAHFHHFSICNQNQSMSISVICGQNTKAIEYCWPKVAHFHHCSICNQNQSISISVILGQNTKAIALTFWPKLAQFHHFSICNQNQSISMSVIFGQNTKAIGLLFGQTWLIFITFQSAIKINQCQFRSFLAKISFQAKIPRLQPYLLAKIGSVSSLVILQSNSINFNFGHFWPKYQGYSLTFWPKLAHFYHFSICNQTQSISISVNFSPKYQDYRLTFWPKLDHFHHFSICNQNQSISISVIFGQNTKAIALLFGQNWLIFITFQSAIKINQFQFRSFLAKIPRLQPYFLAKIGSFSSLFNLQSKSINFNFGHFRPKYQGYSLTFWPKLAHFHHFSICNQNQSISISVIFGQNTKAIALLFGQNWLIFITFQSAIKINQFQFRSFLAKIPRLQPYFLAKIGSFSSLFNLQSKSINFNFGHFWPKYQGYSLTGPKLAHFHHFSICNQNQSISISVIFGQNTKAIALLFGQNWLSFITFQSAIKINQCQFRSFLAKIPRLQPYFLAKISSFSSLFNLQSKSINFNFVDFWPKYQGYSLTAWPKLAQFHHFSICNQNQSMSISVIFGQNTKAIALLFGQNWLSFITFQSAIKLNQFQFRSFLAKIPRLQPYFLAKIGSFLSLFNLQSKSINFNFG